MRNIIAIFASLLVGHLSSAASAQPAAEEGWTRVSPPDGSYSVEVPCSADQITNIPPPQARRQEGDERVTVTCEADGVVFFASRVSVPADVQLPKSLFDLMRDSLISSELGSNMSVTDLTVSERRVLRSREANADGLIGQTDIVEVGDRSALLLVVGAASGTTTSNVEHGVDRFVGSFEVVS